MESVRYQTLKSSFLFTFPKMNNCFVEGDDEVEDSIIAFYSADIKGKDIVFFFRDLWCDGCGGEFYMFNYWN